MKHQPRGHKKHSAHGRSLGVVVLVGALLFFGLKVSGQTDLQESLAESTVSASSVDTTPPAAVSNLTSDILTPSLTPVCGSVSLYPTVNAMGITISSPVVGADHASIRYRQTGTLSWTTGQDAVVINTGEIVGSIFWLLPATAYDVEVTSRNQAGDALFVNQCAATTHDDLPANTVTNILNVSASAAPGGNGSVSLPYTTIQAALNVAQAGDEVLVQAGTYHENLTFPRSGMAGAFIKLVGQTGAVLDGSDATIEQSGFTWTPDGSHLSVYSTTVPLSVYAVSNLQNDPIWRDNQHYYTYDSLAGVQTGTGHGNSSIAEGWFFDPSTRTLTVRSATAPGSHTWHIRTGDTAARLASRSYIWIEGLTMNYYPVGVYVRSSANTVIRGISAQAKTGVMIDNADGPIPEGNRIESSTFADAPLADWGYAAVKGTAMESGAIVAWEGRGNIIRDNRIEQYHDGIFTGDSEETDVYRNVIRHLSDDGLEADGAAKNMRIWGNAVDDVLSSLSIAPVDIGPIWALNNRFTQFSGRAFKIGGGVNGVGFFYHNTIWSNVPGAVGTQQVTVDTDKFTFRNNIFRTADLAIRWTIAMPGINMDDDDVYSTASVPFVWNNTSYLTLSALCSAQQAECHGAQVEPQLLDPANGKFSLVSGSPNVNAAVRLPGINDTFSGSAPDRGYLEFGQPEIQW